MAIITATFDTKEKTLSVEMDGKKMDNVVSADFYAGWQDDGTFRGSVSQMTKSEDDDLTQVTYISASENGEAEITVEEKSNKEELRQALAKAILPKKP
jgi:hypothetical protein